jgi:hypothetical protein
MTGSVGRLAFAVFAALVLALPAESAAPAGTRVKNTSGWIESVGMDGSRVAYAVHGASCTKLFVWDIQTQAGALVSGKQTCAADSTSTGAGVREIAVAGPRIAWIVNLGGNTESDDYLYVDALPRPKEKLLATAMRTGDVDGALAGAWIGGLVGDGDLLAVNTWRTDAAGDVASASLRRIGASRLNTLTAGLQGFRAAAADSGRIAVARADGTVALYSGAGAPLRTIVPTSVKEIALQDGDLVVLTKSRTLEVYSASSGLRRATWPTQPGAARLDVASGLAVYAVGRKVHALRLLDGKDAVLATAPRAIEDLEIEAPGIVYAYNTVKGIKDVGNLAFVPLAKATSLLG